MRNFLLSLVVLLSMNDQMWLAVNIYHEARGEDRAGWEVVMDTTLSRLYSNKYPDTVYDVVWQPSQFSWTQDAHSDKVTDIKKFKEILQFVQDSQVKESTAYQVTHYHNESVRPWWADKFKYLGKVGRHHTYREI